jgi:curved DNA-binding protein CbpA
VSRDDHYLALGIRPDATPDEVQDAWRFAIQVYHPDRFTDPALRDRADQMTRRVNAAWQVLGDAERRARYDRARADGGDTPGPRLRELPCPACGSLAAIPDQEGARVGVRCPACAQEFPAIVGAVLIGRPELQMRFLAGRYRLQLADGAGRLTGVTVRRLPSELALADRETVSVVFGADGRSPRYVVVHGAQTDIGWKVR